MSGCYVFYNSEGEALYVGQSESIRDRLYSHLRTTSFMGEVDRIDIYQCKRRKLTEMYLLGKLKPKYNKKR